MKPDLYIIDGSSYIFRAYFAIRPLRTSKGIPTNATMGFTKMILKLISDFKPEFIAMVFDTKEKNFRHKLYPQYKANRDVPPEDLQTQIPYIHRITEALNIPAFMIPGHEADDIIATISLREKKRFNVTIVSGDKDLMQLVDSDIRMFDPMRDRVYDVRGVEEKMGVTPSLIHDYLAITGDSSDNIPGVSGIGPKGAVDLINKYGSLENIYKNIENITGSKQRKLIDSKEQAFLSKKLTTLLSDSPCKYTEKDLKLKEPDADMIKSLFNELEFKSLLNALNLSPHPKEEEIKVSGIKSKYHTILTKKDFEDLLKALRTAEKFAIDTETDSLEPRRASLIGISFSIREGHAFYIPIGHSYVGVQEQLQQNYVLDKLKPILENNSIKKIGQNIKYDMIVLQNYGIALKNIFFDTMIASYILNPEIESHSLDKLSEVYLHHSTIKYSDVTGSGKSKIPFSQVEIARATEYAAEDADCTLRLFNIFISKMNDHPSSGLFFDIEMPLISVLASTEAQGVSIDTGFLRKLSKEYNDDLCQIQKEIYKISGEEFNINSTKQLSRILFNKLGIKPISKTKTGFSTNSEVLGKLSKHHEIASKLLEYRELAKLKNTYIDALPELVYKKTNRIHTSYNQTITTTGRLSSSNPNLQNIPIRTPQGEKIRKAFIAPGSNTILAGADYNQIELRIMAHMANDSAFIEDFKSGKDIHRQTAMRVFGLSESTYTPEYRRRAKAINFGLIYGMGPYALSESLGITQKEAKMLIDIYFKRHPGIKAYMDKTIKMARENGYVETLFSRRRYFPGINDKNKMVQRNNERAAINAPIQGSSADIIKIAMINIHRRLDEFGAKMILQVHDELVFEVPQNMLDKFLPVIRSEMEGVTKLKVPLLVDISTGKNWLEAH